MPPPIHWKRQSGVAKMVRNKSLTFWAQFCLLNSIIIGSTNHAYSAPLFSLDFESGLPDPINTPIPVWALPPQMAKTSGTGNLFEVVNNIAHSGNSSLRFNPNGRNGLCNTCGGKWITHDSGSDGADFFVSSTQEDLSISDTKGPAAQSGKLLYNATNGFSKWEIISVENENATNDKLIVKKLHSGINDDPAIFSAEDSVFIARQCGVDGNFTSNINQRNDCNSAIHPLVNVAGSQSPGQSIFRRFYLRMDMVKPGSQKLRYWTSNITNPPATHVYLDAKGGRDTPPIYPLVFTVNVETIDNGHLNLDNGKALYVPGSNPGDLPEGLSFERGKWYYIEEEFLAATLDPSDPEGKTYNNDGEYRLWFSESGKEGTDGATPILEILEMKLPVVERATFWGNFQHQSHTIGQIYIDDFEITSDTKIGAKASNHASIFPPKPASIINP